MGTLNKRLWRRLGVALLLVAMPAFGGDAGSLVVEELGDTARLLVRAAATGTDLAV